MAQQPDLTQILAALAASQQQSQAPPSQAGQPAVPPMAYPSMPAGTPQGGIPAYPLPQPSSSGNLDLSNIKPVSSGSVSFQDALNRAKGFAAERGISSDGGRREDPRLNNRSDHHRSRSRSRTPPRREQYGDSYNPYRDERRDPRRNFGRRSRSRSPARDSRGGFSPARNYTRDRSPPPGENSETITVQSNVVGLVIGRQGENLRRVEQDTGTRIQFITGPDTTGPHRQCRITGSPRAREHAKEEIFRIIDANRQAQGGQGGQQTGRDGGRTSSTVQTKPGHQPALREGENSTQIMVPDKTVGLIIGRGGETIRDLQDRSGCHINIVGENKSVNGLRPVNLIGSQQAANRAKELIMEIVESDTRNGGQGTAANTSRGQGDAYGDQYGASNNKLNETIHVPSEAVGMIIGKGGETIREMQNQTACKINVSQASGRDVTREIGLIGTKSAIDAAKRTINEKVEQVRAKNAGSYGGGSGGRNDQYAGSYSQSQQPFAQQQQTMAPDPGAYAAPSQTTDPNDPYAAYGGYQNYVLLWQLSQQGQQGAAQAGQPAPPGQ